MYIEKFEKTLNNKLQEAGFTMKKDFAEAFHLSPQVIQFNKLTQNTAKRCLVFFEWAIKAHKLSEIENLTKENQDLKKEIAKIKDKKQRSKHA